MTKLSGWLRYCPQNSSFCKRIPWSIVSKAFFTSIKFKPSALFLVAMTAAKDMKCATFPNLALSTLLALMNVLVTFNAHLSLSDTLPIDIPSFLFFTTILSCVSLPGIILCNTIYISLFTLCFDEIHLIGFSFILSRDVFVLTGIKTRVVFPDPPLLTPDEEPSLETSIFSLSFQVVREPLPFAYR